MRENGLMPTPAFRHFPAVAATLLLAATALAQRPSRNSAPADFSYYMLVLSYAPDFCAQPQGEKDPRECGAGRHIGFVVHGLWPQGENDRGPERCGPSRPVSQTIVQIMLSYIPTPGLIQHEWTSHGTCSGLAATDYFAAVRTAHDGLHIPADLAQPSHQLQLTPTDVENRLAAANPNYPRAAFRTSCYRDGDLQEVRVCLNKDLSPRPCGRSAGECRIGTITMLPVR
jgi:ribonuclease T2